MCGIVGFAGHTPAAPVLLDGLGKLNIEVMIDRHLHRSGGEMHIAKKQGRLSNLMEATHNGADVPGNIGIGHTRWATHGARRMSMPIPISAATEGLR